jgi:uncharacterized protein YbdZ (MbtH family)
MRRVALLAAVLLLAGCGSDDPHTKKVDKGRASGAGFSFTLPDGWRAVDRPAERQRLFEKSAAGKVKGLDTAGFLTAGVWGKDDAQRGAVVVIVEPVPADTSDAVVDHAVGTALEQFYEDVHPLASPAQLGGGRVRAARYRYEDSEQRALAARRGDYLYTVNIAMRKGNTAKLDALFRQIVSTWRWSAGTAPPLERLRHFTGSGYAVTLPAGWRATGKLQLAKAADSPQGVDSVWRGVVGERFATNVNIISSRGGGDIATLVDQLTEAERGGTGGYSVQSIRRGADAEIDGEPAASIEIRARQSGIALRTREFITTHAGRIFQMTLATLPERFEKDAQAFAAALQTWRWKP